MTMTIYNRVLRNKDNAKQKHFAEKYIGNLHIKAGSNHHHLRYDCVTVCDCDKCERTTVTRVTVRLCD